VIENKKVREQAREQWRVWEELPEEAKKLRQDLLPTLPRPGNEY